MFTKKERRLGITLMRDSSIEPKLTITRKEFIINEKKKTVTCVLRGYYNAYKLAGCYEKDIQTIGIAKCHKDDVFDKDKGARIASAKAEIEAFRTARDISREYLAQAKELERKFFNASIKFSKNVDVNKRFIEKVGDMQHETFRLELNPDAVKEEK